MIYKWLISHQIKEATRSSFWQKQVALNIVMGLLLLIMLAYLVMLGFFLNKVLTEIFPEDDPVVMFNRIVLYYFGFEFLIRFMMQSLPVLNIDNYLTLPIRRSSIVHYVTAKSLASVGNYLSWLVFIPFALKAIAPRHPATVWIWILAMILLVFTNNFIATFAKRQLAHKAWVALVFFLILGGLIALDHFKILALSDLSGSLMNGMLRKPWLIAIPAATVAASYLVNYLFLRNRLYPDEISRPRKEKAGTISEMRYLKSIGLTGHLISLDLRLIMRNKRTKTILYLSPIFLLYGLLFYQEENFRLESLAPVFIGIFMTGGMMISYLNYCFSYESNHFDSILANYADFRQYIRAKYLLAVTMTSICYILTIPYVFFGYKILLINTTTFLYNIGFLAFGMIFISTYSTRSMDLSRSASFNYQGMGAAQWLSMVPGFLLPLAIVWVFKKLGNVDLGYVFIGALGLAGLVLYKSMVGMVTRQFMKRRHEMAKGFRE